jgi:hypothetical protein
LHILNLFNSKNQVKIKGLKGSLKTILLEQIYLETNANIIILTNDKKAAEEFYNDLKINLGEDLISLILFRFYKIYLTMVKVRVGLFMKEITL